MKDRFKRNVATVGGLTGISRVLGLLRDVVIAWLLGAGALADAFFVAFRIPNLLRRFMAEGAASVAFVPVFNEIRARDGLDKALAISHSVMTLMFWLLCATVILGEIIAPVLVAMIAPGFVDLPVFDEAVHLTRIMFPYIMLIGMVALVAAILNSLGHFAAPAAAPIVLNIFMIGVPLVFNVLLGVIESPAEALAWGVVAGGVAQLLLQFVPLKRRGIRLGFSRDLRNRHVRQIIRLMCAGAVGASVYQLTVLMGTLLASLLDTGSVSYLYYAGRVMELPLGIFAFAVSNVMLPDMSSAFAGKDLPRFGSLIERSLETVLLFTVPATVGLLMLSQPVMSILFVRGEFSAADAAAAAVALNMYALGLWAVGCSRIYTQALYAMQEAKLVANILWIVLGVFVLASLALMPGMRHAGIALASSISVLVQLVVQWWLLRRRGVSVAGPLKSKVLRMVIAALFMAGGLVPFLRLDFWRDGLALKSAGLLLACIVCGAFIYFAVLRIMGLRYPLKLKKRN